MKALSGKSLVLLTLIFICGCSSLSISTVKDGEFRLGEGRLGELEWKEDLIFKRFSWYYELSLLYEFLIAEVPVNSNYRRWFTSGESISANSCGKFYVAAVYASRDDRTNPNHIWKEFDTNKVKFINVNGFYRNLSFSESFVTNSFNLYKFWGICVKNKESTVNLKLALPGYIAKQISL